MYSLIIVVVILINFNPSDADIEANGTWLCSASCNNNSIVKIEANSKTQTAPLTCNDAITSNWTTNYKFYYADKTYVMKTLTYQSVYHMINGSLFFSGTAKTNLKGCGDVLVAITLKTNPSNPVNCSSKLTSVTTISNILVKGQNCLATCNGSVTVKYTSGVQQTPPQSCPIPPSSSSNPTAPKPNARGVMELECDTGKDIVYIYWLQWVTGYVCNLSTRCLTLKSSFLVEFNSREIVCTEFTSLACFSFKTGRQTFNISGEMLGEKCAGTTFKVISSTPSSQVGGCTTDTGLESINYKNVTLIAEGKCAAKCVSTRYAVKLDPPIKS